MALFGFRKVTTVLQDDCRLAAKPFDIPKRLIWEARKRVAANKGAPGVDKESIEMYQNRMGQNLYTLWNRMSSGSYLPQPGGCSGYQYGLKLEGNQTQEDTVIDCVEIKVILMVCCF